MTKRRFLRGRLGESVAVSYLENQQFQILERNYYTKHGEIDVIAMDPRLLLLIFVEVKSYQLDGDIHPLEVMTSRKQRHLVKTAECYIVRTQSVDIQCRFDLIIVDQDKVLDHIEDIIQV